MLQVSPISSFPFITIIVPDTAKNLCSRYSDWLRTGRSGNRILVVVVTFFAPVQYSPGAHTVSYIVGVGSFSDVRAPKREVDHPKLSSAEVNVN
jgi:hypothetical protein